jgi:hypothetical protein
VKLLVTLSVTCVLCSQGIAADTEGLDFFESKIRPVLIEHCYECHSVDSNSLKGGLLVDSMPGLIQGGDSGTAIVKGKPVESLLVEAMKFESFEMPPAGKLPDEVIADFEKWVAMGAPDPRTELVKSNNVAQAIDIEAGRQFWAFQPPEEHVEPEVEDGSWSKNWIDGFVLHRLEEKSIKPMPDAERSILLRRLAYDLTGLPPNPDQLEKILYSEETDLLAKYIDDLIASPHFGEHWGRHWLDVARYADSNGGDFNATFHNAWRYRNYVIETFNEDRPFNEFVIEQIAGDLIQTDDDSVRENQLVATGFLMFGAKMLSERDKEKLRMDVVDEQVTTIGKAFMGMTLGCARCHDHKFDPIPTTDYYALAGILRSTQTLDGEIQKYVSNWTRQPLPISDEHAASLKEYKKNTADLKSQIKAAEKELKLLETNSSKTNILKQGIILDDAEAEVIGNWKASTYSKNFIGKGYIHDDQQDRGQKRVVFTTQVPEDGEYEVRFAFPGSRGRATNVPVLITHADGETSLLVNQSKQAPILTMLKPLGQFRFTKDQTVRIEISNKDANGYVIVDAIQIISVKELKESDTKADIELQAEVKRIQKVLKETKERLNKTEANAPPPAPLALAVQEAEKQGDYFVCIRGEHRNLGPKVSRGFLSVANFEGAPSVQDDDSGRLALAKWVADARHPLTARVYVNRVWYHLMGAGLVRSVDNFGSLGERPTHPLLLDQLAVKFIENNWSTKWLVREIVNSRTYQLSSKYEESRWQADPENRLLWRAHRKPLPAESIRDTMLLAAGQLDFSIGEAPVKNLGTLVTQNKPDDTGVKLQSTNIRTVYQPVIRNELPSLMRVFDFADPDFVSGQRAHTTVPTQALWMLNGPFIANQAELVSTRMLEQKLSTQSEQLERLFILTLGRPPSDLEATVSQTFLENSELPSEITPQESWSDLAHAIFASAGFRMLD